MVMPFKVNFSKHLVRADFDTLPAGLTTPGMQKDEIRFSMARFHVMVHDVHFHVTGGQVSTRPSRLLIALIGSFIPYRTSIPARGSMRPVVPFSKHRRDAITPPASLAPWTVVGVPPIPVWSPDEMPHRAESKNQQEESKQHAENVKEGMPEIWEERYIPGSRQLDIGCCSVHRAFLVGE